MVVNVQLIVLVVVLAEAFFICFQVVQGFDGFESTLRSIAETGIGETMDKAVTGGTIGQASIGGTTGRNTGGMSGRDVGGRIVGGMQAPNNRYRYAVAIFHSNSYMCAGSIIGPKTVMSAGHCFFSKGGVGPRLNIKHFHGIVGSIDTRKGQRIRFNQLIVHPQYEGKELYNDIAILKTDKVITNRRAAKVCIASSKTGLNQYKKATAMGWGYTDFNIRKPETILRHVSLTLNDHKYCEQRYKKITKKQLCGDGYGKDTCHGDSGGPLSYVDNKKADIVIGITSYGAIDKCGTKWIDPPVFTRVSAYCDWIVKSAGDDGKNICLK